MADNSTYYIEQLIRYMDGELSEQEKIEIEKLLLHDDALKERFENLLAARNAIRDQGLKQRVRAIHNEYHPPIKEDEQTTPLTGKIVKPVFSNSLRIVVRVAAILIFVFAGYGIYEYVTTTNNSMFADNFIKYDLPTVRGEAKQDNIDSLYRQNNYSSVIKTFESKQEKTPKDYFLAALAYLETGEAKHALETFQKLQQLNNSSTEKYFNEETDYYVALAYIKDGNIQEAQKQLQLITVNKQHKYYQKVKEISHLKLQILRWKEE
jgi:tetratricopeptide (TPR) repeat protein